MLNLKRLQHRPRLHPTILVQLLETTTGSFRQGLRLRVCSYRCCDYLIGVLRQGLEGYRLQEFRVMDLFVDATNGLCYPNLRLRVCFHRYCPMPLPH